MAENPLPALPSEGYEKQVLGFRREAYTEGLAFCNEESGYKEIPDYLQYLTKGDTGDVRHKDIAYYPINRAAKAIAENSAAISDTKPLFGFRSPNPGYDHQAEIINQLIKHWWLSESIDGRLGDIVTWSQVAGSGYGICAVNDNTIGLETIDPRDIIPIRPTSRNSVEDCLGVIIRSVISINYAKRLWPDKAGGIQPSYEGSFMSSRLRRGGQLLRSVTEKLTGGQSTQDMNVPMVEIFTMQLRDYSINPTGRDIVMGPVDAQGQPGSNWSYSVKPGAPLYPRGRWIVCTDSVLLSDGPNPYWHGKFTVSKLTLDPLPWSWFGRSQLKDLIPLNNLLNELVAKVVQAARKNLQPGMIVDKNALPRGVLANLDTMRPNMKLAVNPVLGDAVKFTDQVAVPSFIMELIQFAIGQLDDLAGTRGLQELLTLRQMPGADTLEKLQSSLTPLIKARGRRLEIFLRQIAEMVKYNFFQFYNAPKRYQLLGPDGLAIEDLDFDPGTLVPHEDQNDTRSGPDRAIDHIKNFPFYVVPNSLLDVAQVERKLLYLTLRRMGEIDHETLLKTLDIPDIAGINQRLNSELDQKIAMAAQENPRQGRPPTAQEMPKLESKGGAPIVSESG